MSVDAVWMNFWSVGPQLCPWTLSPRERPLERNENERRRNDADPPQDARIIGGQGERRHHPFRCRYVAIATTRR